MYVIPQALCLLLDKGGAGLKAFVPQLQTTSIVDAFLMHRFVPDTIMTFFLKSFLLLSALTQNIFSLAGSVFPATFYKSEEKHFERAFLGPLALQVITSTT